MREILTIAPTPEPRGCYSRAAITSGRLLFTSGQEPIDPATGKPVAGSMAEQTRQALENLRGVVEAAGGRLENAIKVTAYIRDLGEFGEFDRAYAAFFADSPPARTTIHCHLPGFAVELDAVVALDD